MDNSSKYCSYKQLDNGIHQLELKDASHEAADAYLQLLDKTIHSATENKQPLMRVLVLITSPHLPSLQYLARGAKQLLSKYPNRPRIRSAYVYGEGIMMQLLKTFVQFMVLGRDDKMNFFKAEQRDQAESWLLAE